MKYKINIPVFLHAMAFFLLLFSLLEGLLAEEIKKGQIKIQILGLNTNDGVIRYGLFNSKESFPKEDDVMRKGVQPITMQQCKFVIDDLEYGEYAIAVGHDKNGNGKIDRFFGFLIEPVGISGYEKSLWSRPTFEKAKFSLNEKTMSLKIRLF